MQQVNEKIVGRIQLVQQIYIEDYKTQVKEMTGQLRGIRIMLDEELLRQRCNYRSMQPISACFTCRRRGTSSAVRS
jgi:hypothetical protein